MWILSFSMIIWSEMADHYKDFYKPCVVYPVPRNPIVYTIPKPWKISLWHDLHMRKSLKYCTLTPNCWTPGRSAIFNFRLYKTMKYESSLYRLSLFKVLAMFGIKRYRKWKEINKLESKGSFGLPNAWRTKPCKLSIFYLTLGNALSQFLIFQYTGQFR